MYMYVCMYIYVCIYMYVYICNILLHEEQPRARVLAHRGDDLCVAAGLVGARGVVAAAAGHGAPCLRARHACVRGSAAGSLLYNIYS